MVRRTQRLFSDGDQNQLIQAVGICRSAAIAAITKAPIGGVPYKAAVKLQASLDDVVEALTGRRDLFHAPGHGTHTNCFGRPEGEA